MNIGSLHLLSCTVLPVKQCCQSVGFYPNSTDFEGPILCLFYAYSDFLDSFSVCYDRFVTVE